MRLPAAAALALVLLAAACSRQPATLQTAPNPAASAAPGQSTAPASAALTPASPYHFVVTPPAPSAGQPGILEIDMLEQTIHEGAPYSVRVKTTPDVTTIAVSAMGRTYTMQSAAPGLYATDGQVPDGIPFFLLNRSYDINVTAQTADGRATSITVSVRLEK
jgi:hypothetical protein